MSDFGLSLDAFLRSIEVNKEVRHSFLLGAGASISSSIMSAEMCIWKWKQEVFLSKNPDLNRTLFDISLPNVRTQIQKWLDNEAEYPKLYSTNEFSFFAERSYPIAEDRRKFFQNLANGKTPFVGYQYLSLLAEFGLISSIWTTNFDGLITKALIGSAVDVIEIGLDTQGRLNRQQAASEILSVALHGDYRYDALKNTDKELQEQDERMRAALVDRVKNSSLIISGCSGRDDSIMETLADGFTRPGSGRLYWCGYDSPEPDERVASLLSQIRQSGREAFYISTLGFDDLLERLAVHCLEDELLERAMNIRRENSSNTSEFTPFSVSPSYTVGFLKSNAFEISLPKEILQFSPKNLPKEKVWHWLGEMTKEKAIVAGPLKGKIFALGQVDEIQTLFEKHINGEISRVPISEKDLSFEDSVIRSLLLTALVKALAKAHGLLCNNKNLVWKSTKKFQRTINGVAYDVFEAVNLSLKHIGSKYYLILKPAIEARHLDGSPANKEVNQNFRFQLLSKQYNRQFNDALNSWRDIVIPTRGVTEVYFPDKVKDSVRFRI